MTPAKTSEARTVLGLRPRHPGVGHVNRSLTILRHLLASHFTSLSLPGDQMPSAASSRCRRVAVTSNCRAFACAWTNDRRPEQPRAGRATLPRAAQSVAARSCPGSETRPVLVTQ